MEKKIHFASDFLSLPFKESIRQLPNSFDIAGAALRADALIIKALINFFILHLSSVPCVQCQPGISMPVTARLYDG